MGTGYLAVRTNIAGGALPLSGVDIHVFDTTGNELHNLISNDRGSASTVSFQTPDRELTFSPEPIELYYTPVDVLIEKEGFEKIIIRSVHIIDGETSILALNLIPLSANQSLDSITEESTVPESACFRLKKRLQETSTINPALQKMVVMPDSITVHLGQPDMPAQDVRVPFLKYIKNVVSHEIIPTWPESALEANILCYISYALNRVYTDWYHGKGYEFDITNSATYDLLYAHNAEIYLTVNNAVNQVWNQYVKRAGRMGPYFTQFCNGVTSTCAGLWQWKTVDLARQGQNALKILRNFYPQDIDIATINASFNETAIFPGFTLVEGSSGESVKTMQDYLNRIRVNYPFIPSIDSADGIFGTQTKAAITMFQSGIGVYPTGTIDRHTWYLITRLYDTIARLTDMSRKGKYIEIKSGSPITTLEEGMRGGEVAKLQYMLNFIAMFYPTVPYVTENGMFDEKTASSVRHFEILSGLVVDGRAGQLTWQALYDAYDGILQNVDIPEPPPGLITSEYPYPGFQMRMGSQGEYVMVLQRVLQYLSIFYPQIARIEEDGNFGNVTRNAVVAFQSMFGLTPDGVVGPLTWSELMKRYVSATERSKTPPYPDITPAIGSSGDSVMLIQTAINSISETEHIPKVTVNGEFDEKTSEAISTFQKLHGLYANGAVDPVTWEVIMNAYYNRLEADPNAQVNQSNNATNPISQVGAANEAALGTTGLAGQSVVTPNEANNSYVNGGDSAMAGTTANASAAFEFADDTGFSLDEYANEYQAGNTSGEPADPAANTIESNLDTTVNDSIYYGSLGIDAFNGVGFAYGAGTGGTGTGLGSAAGSNYIGPGYGYYSEADYATNQQYNQAPYNTSANQQIDQAGYPVYNGVSDSGAYASFATSHYTPTYQAVPYDSGGSPVAQGANATPGYAFGINYPYAAGYATQSTALTTSTYVSNAVAAVSRTILFLYLLKLLQERQNCYCEDAVV